MATELAAEIAELQAFLQQAKAPGNVRDLTALLRQKQQQQQQQASEEMEVDAPKAAAPAVAPPKPVKVEAAAAVVDDVAAFTEISRFGWEDDGYGKNKVSVLVMSGVDGVGDLPEGSVTCNFTKSSFDLKIMGLNGKNFRLVKPFLEKEIVPEKSSFRVKKNRVTVTLWKKDKDEHWMNLTAKNPAKAAKPKSSDPAAGIMEMMQNMYEDGDEDMKRTIAKAWTESRDKNAAAGF